MDQEGPSVNNYLYKSVEEFEDFTISEPGISCTWQQIFEVNSAVRMSCLLASILLFKKVYEVILTTDCGYLRLGI